MRKSELELEVAGLTKTYGDVRALQNFQYRFTPGVYGLLGPNGAGKSTLMNLLTDNLKPTEGEIFYRGEPVRKLGAQYRKVLGYMPQQQGLYPDFTLERFLWYMASLKGLKKREAQDQIDQMVQIVNLEQDRGKKLRGFSGGMKQRALIAQALLGNPEIVILDEPTAGLDPKERIRIRNLIAEVALEKIVIIATHVVSDIAYIAKEVLFLKKGKLLDSGVPYELCSRLEHQVYELVAEESQLPDIQRQYKVGNIAREGVGIRVRILSDSCPKNVQANVCTPDLEDLYLHYFD